MRRDLVIAAGPGEWRAALAEKSVPVELYVERGNDAGAGSIHLGRVVERAAALDAVFVEIGDARPAFLPLRDAVAADRPLDEGARVLVQVRREAQRDKAARLSTRIVMRRRALELVVGGAEDMPANVAAPADRDRLVAALGEPQGLALRLFDRGAATPALDAMVEEAAALGREWRALRESAARAEPPARLHPAAGLAASLAARLPTIPDTIIIDDIAALTDIRAAFPAVAAEHRAPAELPIDLDAAFDAALSASVPLPQGGMLRIAETHAAVLIDVDSGTPEGGSPARAALAVNLAAAREIARQLRLRNLGGGIVVDFVGMEGRNLRERVRATLTQALAGDPGAPHILGWTRLGHLELVRPRRGQPLAAALLEGATPLKSAATAAHEALRALSREARARPGARWCLAVAPDVADALRGPASKGVRALEARLGAPIAIKSEAGRARQGFEAVPL